MLKITALLFCISELQVHKIAVPYLPYFTRAIGKRYSTRGGAYLLPLSISKTRCATTMIFLYEGRLPPKFFKKFGSGSDDVITRIDDVIKVNFFPICNFLRFWKFSDLIFANRFLKHSHYHHSAITWYCDVIGEKDFSALALYFAYGTFWR